VKVDVEKGALRIEKESTIDMLVSSTSRFHSSLSYGDSPQLLSCLFLLGFVFGSRFLQTIGTWRSHGLPIVLLSGLWLLRHCILVCLIQLVNYMLWMEKKTLNDFLIRK
jgi:hypothetical protein